MLSAEIHVTQALVAVNQIRGLVDEGRCSGRRSSGGGGGYGAHGSDAVGPTWDHSRASRIGNSGLATGVGARLILTAHGFRSVVVNQVKFDEGVAAEAVVPLCAQAALHAVVVIVLGAIIPDEGGLCIRLLIITIGPEKTERVFAVEGVYRNGEIFGVATEDCKFFDVGSVEQGVGTALFTQGNLLGEPRGLASTEVIADATFLALIEWRLGFKVHSAPEGIDAAIGGLALGEF